jgi:RNA polymerase sigma factor (sigma-70 family)
VTSRTGTELDGAQGRFPQTRGSVVLLVGSADPDVRGRAFGLLAAANWKPVYQYQRLRWRLDADQAEDLTQGFFARALEKRLFERYDASRARFRTYLRTCLDGYVANERKAARRLKRGGGAEHLSLAEDAAAGGGAGAVPTAEVADPEACFEREWVRSLFAAALDDLREHCMAAGKSVHHELFERYDLDGSDAAQRPTYAALAQEYCLPVTQVTNYLAWTRRELRRLLLERLRDLCGSDEEYRAEARTLLRVEPG